MQVYSTWSAAQVVDNTKLSFSNGPFMVQTGTEVLTTAVTAKFTSDCHIKWVALFKRHGSKSELFHTGED